MSIEDKQEIVKTLRKGSWAKFIISGMLSGFSAAFALGMWKANDAAWKNNVSTTLLDVKTKQDNFQNITNSALAGHSTDIVNIRGRVIFLEATIGYKRKNKD